MSGEGDDCNSEIETMGDVFEWSRCFICFASLRAAASKKKSGGVSTQKKSKTTEILFQYLLETEQNKPVKQEQESVGEGILHFVEARRDRTRAEDSIIRNAGGLCEKCELVAGTLQELHLQLEVVQMKIAETVTRLRSVVVSNSRLYGENLEAKESLKELEKWIEEQEKAGRNVEVEKRFMVVLQLFQTLVFEKGPLVKIPLVRLQKTVFQLLPNEAVKHEVEDMTDLFSDEYNEEYEAMTTIPPGDTVVFLKGQGGAVDIADGGITINNRIEKPLCNSDVETMTGDRFTQDTAVKTRDGRSRASKRKLAYAKVISLPNSQKMPSVTQQTKRRIAGLKRKLRTSAVKREPLTRKRSKRRRRISYSSSTSDTGSEREDEIVSSKSQPPLQQSKKLTKAQKLGLRVRSRWKVMEKSDYANPSIHMTLFCDVCQVKIRGRIRAEEHFEKHELEQKNHFCPDCHKGFTHPQYFHLHAMFVCGFLKLKCDVCHQFIAPIRMKEHLQAIHQHQLIYECEMCSFCFGSFPSLIMHQTVHRMTKKTRKCDLCPAAEDGEVLLFDRGLLLRHLSEVHGYGEASLVESKYRHCTKAQVLAFGLKKLERWSKYQRGGFQKVFSCQQCEQKIRGRPNFEQHLKEHEMTEKNHTCPDCGRGFTHKSMWEFHVLYYCGMTNISCDTCSEVVAPIRMRKHLESAHPSAAIFACHFCDVCFSSFVSLINHTRWHPAAESVTRRCGLCPGTEVEFGLAALQQHLYKAHGHITDGAIECKDSSCSEIFFSYVDLEAHQKDEGEQKRKKKLKALTRRFKFPCDVCEARFPTEDKLDAHRWSVHRLKPDRFKCTMCNKPNLNAKALAIHKARHHGEVEKGLTTFTCEICSKNYYDARMFKRHIDSHSEDKAFKCEDCGFATHFKYSFELHCKSHGEKKEITCTHCSKQFFHRQQFSNHQRYCSEPGAKLTCDECGFVAQNRLKYWTHIKLHKDASPSATSGDSSGHVCNYPQCGFSFSSGSALQTHKSLIHREKSYRCELCSKLYSSKSSLYMHKRNIHSSASKEGTGNVEQLTCSVCGHIAKGKISLKAHVRNVHDESHRKLQCPHCPKKYAFKAHFEAHVEGHSTEKKYLCDKCPAAYIRQTALNIHQMNRHYEGSESGKELKCEVCGLVCRFLSSFKRHVLSHDESARKFQCPHCPKKYSEKRILETHLLTHSDEKKFTCELCGLAFRHMASMQDHKKKKHLPPPTSSST